MASANDRINSALGKHNYVKIKKVGEGSFGAAILVQHSSDRDKDTKAIVKMIDVSRASKQEKDDALKESKVLSELKHPYIVRYRESFHEDGWLCIVMDYCEGGDLSDRIKKMRQSGKVFPQEQVLRWFTQAILALKYIHDLHILHRDLKSGNFFLSKSGNIKMGDFGIAKVLECTAACAQTQIGTPYYLSPEICQGKPYGWSSDIWAMGCILYEMCARHVPFDAPDLKSLIQRITKGTTPEVPADYSAAVRELCKELLDRDASKRPPASEILKRPVVQEVVRKMLEEVKSEEDAAQNTEAARPGVSGGAAGSAVSKASGPYGGHAGCYVKGEAVEYHSDTHGEWLPATVTGVDPDGRCMLNVKPNVWLSLEIQSLKVRPRGVVAPPGPPAPAQAARLPPPRPPASGAPPPGAGSPSARTPSERRTPADGPAARNPSRDALPAVRAGRNATPERGGAAAGVPTRVASGERGRRPTPSRREAAGQSPFRGAAAGVPSKS